MGKLAHSYSSLKMFDNCPKRFYHERIAKEVKDQGGTATIWGFEVHEHLERRLRDKTPLPEGFTKYEPLCVAFENLPGTLMVEQEMTLTDQLEITGWWDQDAWLRSKLDVLNIVDHDAVVSDWKTGKRRPDFDQLEMFAIQTFKHHPEVQRVRVNFVWLQDMKMDTRNYTRLDAPALWNKLLTRIHRVETAVKTNNFPAKPSGLCGWCPAKHMCEFAR